ncbi:regulatory protein RecX [Candidatus Gottesmanbacteria bacterium]|nr:regulatory protein RecX [Candidatus Gottesmanbacteria bacterium]
MVDGQYQRLLDSAFRFISFRPRSEKEIQDFLIKKLKTWKMYGPELVEKIVKRLMELGYVDDEKFVRWWVEQRQGRKPKGMQLIIYELLSKGIARNVIEHVLSSEIGNQAELAKKALQPKVKTVKDKNKLMGFLERRGFDRSTARSAVDALLGKR